MIIPLFSERTKPSENDEIYQYEEVPQKLRVQAQQILIDAIGPHEHLGPNCWSPPPHNPSAWEFIHKTICREYGVHRLGNELTEGQNVISFLGSCSAEQFVDVVEISTRYIERIISDWSSVERETRGIAATPTDAIDEINYRFRKSGFGFQFEDGHAFRLDSTYTHEEVIKPALTLISRPGFEGPKDEFLEAHRYFREGDYEATVVEAAKSFESTLKAICEMKRWE
ncbi:STM4504/CBY_0614 family protein [Sphingomicrobium lutaoense]|uniref:HEPN AbiJ-N-terminal domain-containing protein n=1 Tax=Sphingomicrobium lutaoense TaxID=515949 RepID=A0A839Z1H2_9SPHN|nr:hypothetical protein [Sphingomicrobium lutaoense]MBB3764520.1 hypothetical protein [Sphingomicrobium lutaoense]